MDERARIDAIVVRELTLPFRTPFRVPCGVLPARRSLVVELWSDGAVGYGESAPCEEPFYSDEMLAGVRVVQEELYLPRLVGRTFESIAAFDAALRDGVRGNPFARAGLENAYWDLCCRRSGVPLVEAIARAMERAGVPEPQRTPRPAVPSGVALGIPEDERAESLEREIRAELREGYQRVKIKIRPGWDVEAARAARRAAGDGFPLWTDGNASFDLERHIDVFKAMDDLGLLFHEQPLEHRDLLDHRRLARAIRTPVCLDESLTGARAARDALELEASRIWNIKVQRVGGLVEALEVYRLAVERGAELWGGTMPESGIGAQAILALGAFPAFSYPSDVEPSRRWYEPGLDPIEIDMTPQGEVPVPRAAGIGAMLDRERYERATRIIFARGRP